MIRLTPAACAALTLTACGVVGAPIPPENVGVAVTIEQQKLRDAEAEKAREAAAAKAAESDPALTDQDVNLPPLRPVGTR
jgi:hypothetical protein